MRITLLLLSLIVFSAHEFWLQPNKFIYKRGEAIDIRFHVGENFEGMNWKGNREKIKTLHLYYGGVSSEMSDHVGEAPGDSLQIRIYDEGNALIAFNSTNSYIELEGPKFTEYLKEDGLFNALKERADKGETDSVGREYYQRCAKTLLKIGNQTSNTFKSATTLPVDIIPDTNPYLAKAGDTLRARVFFQKNPLPGAVVKIWHREEGKTEKTELETDAEGRIAFAVKNSGQWMISAVKMVRLTDENADWQSYWGSFVWGYE